MKLPRSLRVVLFSLITLAGPVLRATEVSNPAAIGFDAARLTRLDAVIQAQIDQKKIAGVVLYVAREGKEVRHRAYGSQDIEAGTAMKTDAIFRIASMSKAVTSTAVMMLYEEGKLMLHDPVSKYIPEFKNSMVAIAPPEGSPPGTKFTTVKAKPCPAA